MVKTPDLVSSTININDVQITPLIQWRDTKSTAATGASAAGARAIGAQLIAFYFRAPVKAFFRTRVE